MKIAVVGCGAVGCFYGAKLARAGHEAHFLLRSDYDAVRRHGVQILSPQGDFRVQPRCASEPSGIGVADLVLIGLKTTANAEFEKLLPPLVGAGTVLLTMQNGLGNEDRLAALFSPGQVMGALCFVCLNRTAPGVVRHIEHGQIVVGEFQGWPEPRTHAMADLFRGAGVPCTVTDSLARAHWEKLTWNIPFNGLGVAGKAGYEAVVRGHLEPGTPLGPCLTTDRLLGEARWAALARELMLEIIAAARALGYQVPDELAEKQFNLTRAMGPYKASTLLDFEAGRELELESLFLEPLRRARAAKTSVPRLEALCSVLTELDEARRSAPA